METVRGSLGQDWVFLLCVRLSSRNLLLLKEYIAFYSVREGEPINCAINENTLALLKFILI